MSWRTSLIFKGRVQRRGDTRGNSIKGRVHRRGDTRGSNFKGRVQRRGDTRVSKRVNIKEA